MTELDSSGGVVWPKFCYSNAQSEAADLPAGLLTVTPPAKQRRRKRTPDSLDAKRDSETPERSPSGSPGSLSSQRSPLGVRLSPPPPAVSQPQPNQPPRNYSDFMRSLAAKYNNNASEYFPSPAAGLLRGFDYSRYGLKPAGAPLLTTSAEKRASGDDPCGPLLPVPPPLAALSGLPMLDVLSLVRPSLAAPAPAPAPAGKRMAEGAPLDLSNMKRPRLEKGFRELFGLKDADESGVAARPAAQPVYHGSACAQKPCSPEAEAVAGWSVDEVAAFVRSVDACAEYAQVFREQGIDGSTLPLLSAEHLTNILQMKLGPALRLRQAVSQRTGQCRLCQHCRHCHAPPTAPVSSALPVSAASSPTGFLPFSAVSRQQ